jgi:hypothetical protein
MAMQSRYVSAQQCSARTGAGKPDFSPHANMTMSRAVRRRGFAQAGA